MLPARLVVIALTASAIGLAAGAGGVSHAASTDFYSCPAGQEPPSMAIGPQHPPITPVPTGTMVTVPTFQSWQGAYEQADIQVGTQTFNLTLDTGSSWMVLSSNAVADNPQIVPTGQRAAVTYGGGTMCAEGPIVTAPVSIGGLEPRQVTFLLAENGNFNLIGILGLNTWAPPASALPIPLQQLGIDTFEFTLPPTDAPKATGTWIVNGEPTIDGGDPRRIAVFDNPALAGGNRIFLPGVTRTATSSVGAMMLDIGTPENIITVFPGPAKELGYDFATQTWASPNTPVRITARPNGTPPFFLYPSVPPVTASELLPLTPDQVTVPFTGVFGLAGTSTIIGVDYVRPWVMGVHFTPTGSVIRLLARERQPALVSRCGKSFPPKSIRTNGSTQLVGPNCTVNGTPPTVKVTSRTARTPRDYRLEVHADGSQWLRTFGHPVTLTATWSADPYLTHNAYHVQRTYRR